MGHKLGALCVWWSNGAHTHQSLTAQILPSAYEVHLASEYRRVSIRSLDHSFGLLLFETEFKEKNHFD